MPLSMVNAGEPFTIKRIGGKEEVKRHLEELGFVVGGVVTVVSEINGSPVSYTHLDVYKRQPHRTSTTSATC